MWSYRALMLFYLAVSSASAVSLATKFLLSLLALLFRSLSAPLYAFPTVFLASLVLLLFNISLSFLLSSILILFLFYLEVCLSFKCSC